MTTEDSDSKFGGIQEFQVSVVMGFGAHSYALIPGLGHLTNNITQFHVNHRGMRKFL